MKIPKIGTRGWLGVVLFVAGLLTFFGARSQAEKDFVQYAVVDQHNTYLLEVSAEKEGYASGTDFLAHEYRHNGMWLVAVGIGLFVWGFKRYNSKKPNNEQPPITQTDKPTI